MMDPEREFREIRQRMERHSELFAVVWQLGEPYFTDSVATACVRFDEAGKALEFQFNPDFWAELSPYEREFLVAHEALHVVLQHATRARDLDRTQANIAADLAVNQMLIRRFGFERGLIRFWQRLMWVDTVFPKHAKISKDNSMERYYRLLDNRKNLCSCTAELLDEHRFEVSDWTEADLEALGEEIGRRLSPEGQAALPKMLRGEGSLGIVSPTACVRPPEIPDWEKLIQDWVRKRMRPGDGEAAQWARLDRRYGALDSLGLLLPSEADSPHVPNDPDKVDCAFFLDASGSCRHQQGRFVGVVHSIPKDRFNVRVYSFDSSVYRLDIENLRITGGGGTRFDILERQIQKDLRDGLLGNYPEKVFVLTDGFGTPVFPRHPERWHWFLTYGMTRFIPARSHTTVLRGFC